METLKKFGITIFQYFFIFCRWIIGGIYRFVSNVVTPYVADHKVGVWLAISVGGTIFSIIFNLGDRSIAGFILSSVLAGITFFDLWKIILKWLGDALCGQYGWDVSLFTAGNICFFLGVVIYFIAPGQMIPVSTYTNNVIVSLFQGKPLEGVLFTAWGILEFGAIMIFIKTRIVK